MKNALVNNQIKTTTSSFQPLYPLRYLQLLTFFYEQSASAKSLIN